MFTLIRVFKSNFFKIRLAKTLGIFKYEQHTKNILFVIFMKLKNEIEYKNFHLIVITLKIKAIKSQ